MNDNVEKFVSDMKKVIEFEKIYGKLEYTEQMNTGKLVLDAVEKGLIKSTLDLVYICNELPELTYDICRYFDIYLFNKRRHEAMGIRRLRKTVEKEERNQEIERRA
ncbi:MAG: hypothetical protein E7231_15330 [Cellulosilyticum sp.]|nr:hypothetical protein [Cellulosilyticum sp.]